AGSPLLPPLAPTPNPPPPPLPTSKVARALVPPLPPMPPPPPEFSEKFPRAFPPTARLSIIPTFSSVTLVGKVKSELVRFGPVSACELATKIAPPSPAPPPPPSNPLPPCARPLRMVRSLMVTLPEAMKNARSPRPPLADAMLIVAPLPLIVMSPMLAPAAATKYIDSGVSTRPGVISMVKGPENWVAAKRASVIEPPPIALLLLTIMVCCARTTAGITARHIATTASKTVLTLDEHRMKR
ncbi:MAG: hypothetical protein FGM15_10160, partial [Chthoniobacterales bacterium]|nr:hypothetical protein [Chthoniobacterales bacterium]